MSRIMVYVFGMNIQKKIIELLDNAEGPLSATKITEMFPEENQHYVRKILWDLVESEKIAITPNKLFIKRNHNE